MLLYSLYWEKLNQRKDRLCHATITKIMFGFKFRITDCLSSTLNTRQHSWKETIWKHNIVSSKVDLKNQETRNSADQLGGSIKKVHLLSWHNALIWTGRRYQNIHLIHEWLMGTVSVHQCAARSIKNKHFISLCTIFYYCEGRLERD